MSVEGETASARQQQHHPGDHDFDPVKDSKPTAPSGSEDQRLRSNDFKLQHSLPNALGCRGEVTRQLQASEPLDAEAFGAFNTACLQPSKLSVRPSAQPAQHRLQIDEVLDEIIYIECHRHHGFG